MNDVYQSEKYTQPTRRSIFIGTVLAALVATAILVTIVLPVEYGIDPTGLGSSLGLAVIAAADIAPVEVAQPPEIPQSTPDSEQYAHSTDAPFRTETIEIPMQGEKESLNVAVAAGIILFSMTDL